MDYQRDQRDAYAWRESVDSRLTGIDARLQGLQGGMSYQDHFYTQHLPNSYVHGYDPYHQWNSYEELRRAEEETRLFYEDDGDYDPESGRLSPD